MHRSILIPVDGAGSLRPGKPIDAVVHDAQYIYAVDDLVRPRWVLVYPVEGGYEKLPVRTHRLPPNGTYEHYYAAAAGPTKLALLSTTVNRGRVQQHVTVLSTPAMSVAGTCARSRSKRRTDESREQTSPAPAAPEPPSAPETWHQLAVVDERIFVAAGDGGLVVMDRKPEPNDNTPPDEFAAIRLRAQRISGYVPDTLRPQHYRLPIPGAVVGVGALPGGRLLLQVTSPDGGHVWEGKLDELTPSTL